MATQEDVRAIARTLPGTIASRDHFAFSVARQGKERGYAWVWNERVHPKKARVPQPAVLAVRVANELEKAALLDVDAEKFFTEPHYNGFPAVLVRLAAVSVAELRQVLFEAWRCCAPPALIAADEARPARATRAAATSKRANEARAKPAKPVKPRAKPAKPRAKPAKPRAKPAKPASPAARQPRARAAKPR